MPSPAKRFSKRPLRATPVPAPSVSLTEFVDHDFGAVLSNGHDTILEFNFQGNFHGHKPLSLANRAQPFCPYRQAHIAEWTTAHERRIAFTLNRLGDILIYHDHMLVFARRAGAWHFLTHSPVIQQMNVPRNPNLRVAIYETCLDASFARTGACIGVVQVDAGSAWRGVIAPADMISGQVSVKTRALTKLIGDANFQDLDRRTRQEIVAIDGATVISHRGAILAAGAILQIAGGSTGGGRLAAAKALSEHGLGIKVSQDGGISGYRRPNQRLAFRVM